MSETYSPNYILFSLFCWDKWINKPSFVPATYEFHLNWVQSQNSIHDAEKVMADGELFSKTWGIIYSDHPISGAVHSVKLNSEDTPPRYIGLVNIPNKEIKPTREMLCPQCGGDGILMPEFNDPQAEDEFLDIGSLKRSLMVLSAPACPTCKGKRYIKVV